MHHHLEIIMPPTNDVAASVAQIMKPFDENQEEGKDPNAHSFWDFYVIGGRWAGEKIQCSLDDQRKESFFEELTKRGVTVSSFQVGKQRLHPSDQIPIVDALWNEFFPDSPAKACPFFDHFNDQYQDSNGFPDVMPLKEVPTSLTAGHVIIAGPSWEDEKAFEAKLMLQSSIWNGVTHQDTRWDGLLSSAIVQHKERLENSKPEYAAKHTPQDDWLVVTVDYHS